MTEAKVPMDGKGVPGIQYPKGYPFEDMRTKGLLWLINATVFHPRGFSLAFHFDGHPDEGGPATGWSVVGDGSEPWTFGDTPDAKERFLAFEDFLFNVMLSNAHPEPTAIPVAILDEADLNE